MLIGSQFSRVSKDFIVLGSVKTNLLGSVENNILDLVEINALGSISSIHNLLS